MFLFPDFSCATPSLSYVGEDSDLDGPNAMLKTNGCPAESDAEELEESTIDDAVFGFGTQYVQILFYDELIRERGNCYHLCTK